MLKCLRIAVTALSLTACVLAIALWGWSYGSPDYDWKQLSSRWGFEAVSDSGHFTIRIVDTTASVTPWCSTISGVQNGILLVSKETRPMFGIRRDGGTLVADMPCYLPVLLGALCATVPWLPWRFSLQTLFIATTLFAVMLGVVVISI